MEKEYKRRRARQLQKEGKLKQFREKRDSKKQNGEE